MVVEARGKSLRGGLPRDDQTKEGEAGQAVKMKNGQIMG
jgi:hypothetical protein